MAKDEFSRVIGKVEKCQLPKKYHEDFYAAAVYHSQTKTLDVMSEIQDNEDSMKKFLHTFRKQHPGLDPFLYPALCIFTCTWSYPLQFVH